MILMVNFVNIIVNKSTPLGILPQIVKQIVSKLIRLKQALKPESQEASHSEQRVDYLYVCTAQLGRTGISMVTCQPSRPLTRNLERFC
jgi:hypothetical protein